LEVARTVKSFPSSAGVYLMKDRDGQVIYIGKAKNLRKRLSSYYRKDYGKRDWKSIQLIKKVASIEIMMTYSEI
jgi:excinuclease ABC subunit C